MLPPSQDASARDGLASDWMHRGMDLAKANSAADLDQAIECFEKAIALRRTLPLAENPRFRYGLSAGWINRGDALTRRGREEDLAQAIESYDEALVLLQDLPLAENPLYPRRLAIAWINRGFARQKQETAAALADAIRCFRAAIAVLEGLFAAAISDNHLLRAGTWTNLGGALLQESAASVAEARMAAKNALVLLDGLERTDGAALEAGLKARHVLCRALVPEFHEKDALSTEWRVEAAVVVDEALALACRGRLKGENIPYELVRNLFRLGCRIHQIHPPRTLAEFILKNLDPERQSGVPPLSREMHETATVALWNGLEKVQREGFSALSTPHFERLLADVGELRMTEERLAQLRLARLSILPSTMETEPC